MYPHDDPPVADRTLTGTRTPRDPRPAHGRPAREIARRVRHAQRDLMGH